MHSMRIPRAQHTFALMRGRELKFKVYDKAMQAVAFALMRGRELKLIGARVPEFRASFALMRGRELKYPQLRRYATDMRSPSCEGGS